jgi:hypothetical protein
MKPEWIMGRVYPICLIYRRGVPGWQGIALDTAKGNVMLLRKALSFSSTIDAVALLFRFLKRGDKGRVA